MDKQTTRIALEELHAQLLEDILYTELVNEGRGFVDHNLFLIEEESETSWDEDFAMNRVHLLQDTALIPPSSLED